MKPLKVMPLKMIKLNLLQKRIHLNQKPNLLWTFNHSCGALSKLDVSEAFNDLALSIGLLIFNFLLDSYSI